MKNTIITVYGTDIDLAQDARNIVYPIQQGSDIDRMFMYVRDAIIFASGGISKTPLEGEGYVGMVKDTFITYATLESGHTLIIQAPVTHGSLEVKCFSIGLLETGTLEVSDVTRSCLMNNFGSILANTFQDYLVTLRSIINPTR